MKSQDSRVSIQKFFGAGHDFCYSIRPVRHDDKNRLLDLFKQLSPESRYLRFAHGISKLPDEFLEDILELDYEKEMALVACLAENDGNGAIIGIARYVSDDTGETCEFSISVGDHYSDHGVGANLMEHLIASAKQNRLHKMVGYILNGNTKMLRMTKELGFQIESALDQSEFKIATLDL